MTGLLTLRVGHRLPARAGGRVRMTPGIVAAAGAFLAAKVASAHLTTVAVIGAAASFNLWQLIESRHVAHLLGLAMSIAAMWIAYRDRVRGDREVNREKQIEDLGRLARRNAARLDEEVRLREHSEAKVLKLELEVIQTSEALLRLKGFSHSGERAALRPRRPGPPRRVLIVEDHEATGLRLARYLELNGLHAEICRTADEAIALLSRGEAFDVVLLDLLIPGDPADEAPGLAVLRMIRQGRSPMPAVVVVTGSDNPAHHERARNHGAASVLVKPVDLDELLALLGVAAEPAA